MHGRDGPKNLFQEGEMSDCLTPSFLQSLWRTPGRQVLRVCTGDFERKPILGRTCNC